MTRSRPLLHGETTDRIIRAFFDVHNYLGHGFLESVYESAMAMALSAVGLHVVRQPPVVVHFRGRAVGQFRPDLLVDARVVVEIKAGRALDPAHEAQVLNHLRATEIEVGLLLHFGAEPRFRRFVYDNSRKQLTLVDATP